MRAVLDASLVVAAVWTKNPRSASRIVLEAVAGSSGDPVVRVQHVVGLGLAGEERQRGVGERLDQIGQRALRDRGRRARDEVDDPEPALDLDDRRLLRVLGAGEHVAGNAGPSEVRRQRPDVDVHASAVARARLRERRRVDAEHGDAADGH